ncbi:MAG: DUF4174 domain-containing protein [Verrucomicrobiota bacterium]
MNPYRWHLFFSIIGILLFFNTVDANTSDPLTALRWQHRLLIGTLSDQDAVQTFTASMNDNLSELKERKCVVLVWNNGNWITNQSRDFTPEDSDLRDAITSRTKSHPLALVGLDGGVKSRYQAK